MRFLVVTAIVLACQSAHAQMVPIEFAPETPGAVDAGASAVKDALVLTKDPAKKRDAVLAFQKIAKDWPAALHDCYLSLAELRVNALTEAKLIWDRAAARGGPRPKWCTGDLANQLAKAVRDGKFVEVTLAVTPADATIRWNASVEVRGAPSLWVQCEAACDTTFDVSAPGFVTWTGHVALTSKGGRLEARLQPEPKPAPVAPDAGVEVVPQQAPDAGVAPVPASVVIPPAPPPSDDHMHKLPLRKLALGLGIGAAVTAAGAVYMTHYESDKGNRLYKSDPIFDESRSLYVTFGAAAIVLSAVSVASFVAYVVLPDAPAVTLATPRGGGVIVEYSGTFGGAR